MKNPFKPIKTANMSSPERQSMGILDDFAVRKSMQATEGKITKVPVEDYDIVNKAYADALGGGDTFWISSATVITPINSAQVISGAGLVTSGTISGADLSIGGIRATKTISSAELYLGSNDIVGLAGNNITIYPEGKPRDALILQDNTGIVLSSKDYSFIRFLDPLFPYATNIYNLGSSTYKWKDLFLSGKVSGASVQAGTTTISGGNILTDGIISSAGIVASGTISGGGLITTPGTVDIINSGTSGALKIGAVGNQLKIFKAVNTGVYFDSGSLTFQNLDSADTIVQINPKAGYSGVLRLDSVNIFEFDQGDGYAGTIPGGAFGNYFFHTSADGNTASFRVYGYPTGLSLQYGNFKMVDLGGANAFEISSDSGIISFDNDNLVTTGRIASGTSTFSTEGPTDDVDVSGINTLFIDSSSNAVTIGGFAGGVDGQLLTVTLVISGANVVTLEHSEGGATQPIYLHAGADETLSGEFGGWILVCHGGDDWHDCSHAKHV